MSSPLSTVPHSCSEIMSNASSITQFLLLTFTDTRELQLLTFWLYLGIYLAALLGNGLIIAAIGCNPHLHTPMYFFLLNLSLLDLGSLSTTLPKAMANSLWDTRTISYSGCVAQVFGFAFLCTAEFYLLTVMAYDRYVAICKPLHYGTLLGSRACVHMAAAAWGTAFPYALLHTANTFSLPLCQGNAVDQFFCEIPQILKLSCSDTYLREAGVVVVSVCLSFGCFVFIVVSYVQIFRAVLRIPSEQGRHKAFSTCLPHLAVVSLLVSTAMFAYLKRPSVSSPFLNLVMAVLYSVVPPAVNPLIYSMRNQELKDALRKLMTDCFSEAAMNCPFFLRITMRSGDRWFSPRIPWCRLEVLPSPGSDEVNKKCPSYCRFLNRVNGLRCDHPQTPDSNVRPSNVLESKPLAQTLLCLVEVGPVTSGLHSVGAFLTLEKRIHAILIFRSQVCVLLLAFLAPLSCLGPPYFLVTTAKADTDYSVPEQLFLVCQDQGNTDFSEGNLGTDPDQNTIVPRAVSAVLRCAARTAWPSNPRCAVQIPWKQDNLSSMWSHKSLEAAPTLYQTLRLLRVLASI
ncbi:olfactory receptor 14C36-like [Leptosomus discolor]